MSNQKPILFRTPMVQAILNWRKNQTRRTKGLEIINANPNNFEFIRVWDGYAKFCHNGNHLDELYIKCLYGKVGDVLWVRETWIESNHPLKKFLYKASVERESGLKIKYKPSIHMPKEACRIFLKITNIRVERLKDITEEDAIAEGICYHHNGYYKNYLLKKGEKDYSFGCDPVHSFETLWQSINGQQSWEVNPWVWVIEFERIYNY